MAIGTTAAILGAGALGAGASILGSSKQSKAAKSAGDAELQASLASVDETRRQYDLSRSDLAPFRDYGVNALAELSALYGIGRTGPLPAEGGGAAPAMDPASVARLQQVNQDLSTLLAHRAAGYPDGSHGTPAVVDAQIAKLQQEQGQLQGVQADAGRSMEDARSRFTTTPGYQFRLGEGVKAVERSAAARGLLGSGGTLKGIQRFGEGLASNEFDSYANRLAAIAGVGQTATNTTASLGAGAAGNIGNALMAGGNARASSFIGQGNAGAAGLAGVGNSLNSGVNNMLLLQYLNRAA